MAQNCIIMENISYIVDNTFCPKQNKYPGRDYMRCYCYSGKYKECPYFGGDDPYNLHPQSPKRRALVRKIDALPRLPTEKDQPLLDAITREYHDLAPEQKLLVKNRDRIQSAQRGIKQHIANEKERQQDEERLARLVRDIDDLPQIITLEERKNIRSLRQRYKVTPSSLRKEVTNYSRLQEAEQCIRELVDQQWQMPLHYALPDAGAEGTQAPSFGLKFMNLVERFLLWAGRYTDHRRYKARNPFSRCRVMLIVALLIGMNLSSLPVPQHIWIGALVFAGLFLGSQVAAHIKPTWIWVRGGLWLASLTALIVLGVMIALAEESMRILIILAILCGIHPLLAAIGAFFSFFM